MTGGRNNSVLLVGARGSGKTIALDSALAELRRTHGAERVIPVRLSGVLHADEKVGMREIAHQLCVAAPGELEFSRAAGFSENVAFMREVLRLLEGGRRAVIFVLEEFDLFAKGGAKSKQTLLYAVMDLLQQAQVQAAVVGVTCRHDAVEMLEKRVRSRFSFRRILLAPPVAAMRVASLVRAALALPEAEARGGRDKNNGDGPETVAAADEYYSGPEGGPSSGPSSGPSDFARGSVFPPEPGYASRFNAALDAALAAPAAEMALASLEALECTPRAAADLALAALSRMDRDAGVITARDLAQATQTLLADTYVRSLSGASVLELCLVVAASRLHRFRRMPRFNFNHLENELRAMSANDFLGDAGRARGPVLARVRGVARDGARRGGGGWGAGGAGGGGGGGGGRGGARGGRVRGFGGRGGQGAGPSVPGVQAARHGRGGGGGGGEAPAETRGVEGSAHARGGQDGDDGRVSEEVRRGGRERRRLREQSSAVSTRASIFHRSTSLTLAADDCSAARVKKAGARASSSSFSITRRARC